MHFHMIFLVPFASTVPASWLLATAQSGTTVGTCLIRRYRRLGASFPSALVPPAALEGAGRVIGNALALRGVIGHATVHFTAFEVCAPGEIERQAQASQANSNDRRCQRLQAIPPLPAAKQCGCGRRTWRCARERSASPSDAHC